MKKIVAIGTALAITTGIFQIDQDVAKAASTTKYVKVSGGIDLNVRQSASTKSKKVGTIKNNTKVTVLSSKNGWSKISFNKKTAYVYSIYLTSTKPKTASVSSTKVLTYYVKTGTSAKLNVRQSKSTASKLLGSLKNGTKVEVVSYSKTWSKIKYAKGYGYVSSKYIQTKKLTTATVEKPLAGTYYATPGLFTNLNVRKSASTSSEKIGQIKQSTKLTVYAQNSTWTKIKFGSSYGYVSNDYVSKLISVDFKRDDDKEYTVFDVDYLDSVTTFHQKTEKNIAKWGNVNSGFTHTETFSKNAYALFNYETGHGFSINAPIYKGAITGSKTKGYSVISSVNSTVTVKAGTYKNVVVQKFYNSKNKNTKIVYFAPKAGVILATVNGQKTFELLNVE